MKGRAAGAVAASFIILRLTAVPVQDPMKSFRRMCLYIRMATLGKERGVLPVLAVLLLLMFTSFLTQVYASLAIGHQWTAIGYRAAFSRWQQAVCCVILQRESCLLQDMKSG